MTVPVHDRLVGARFSSGAAQYDDRAMIEDQVIATLASFLPQPLHAKNILEVGCGTGRLTRLLLKHFPDSRIEAIDISEGMIALSRQRFADAPHVTWTLADARTFCPSTHYDLVVSSSALHWILDLPAALANLASRLVPGGCFACAIMVNGTLAELHQARRAVAPAKMPCHAMPDELELPRLLAGAGLQVEDHRVESYVNLHPSARDFLQAIHAQGLTGGHLSHSESPLNRSELKTLMAHYEQHYSTRSGQVQATYRAFFAKATRA